MSAYKTRSRAPKRASQETGESNPVMFEYAAPGGTKEVITFTKHDYTQLQSPNYLNDTIITFFMQYHIDNLADDDFKNRVHVFSSFFLSKIKSIYTKTQKSNGKTTSNGKQDITITSMKSPVKYNKNNTNANSSNSNSNNCASRWIKGVKIFEKDFLFLPVCENDHWLLVIVCYPSRSPHASTESIPDDELMEPAVFVLNSTKDPAPGVKKALQKFLAHQWNLERQSERSFAINYAKSNGIRLLFPEVPQQKNNYNCGVYLLNYFKCFMNSPREAYVKMFRQRSLANWFEANEIRVQNSRTRLIDIVRKQSALWSATATTTDNNNKAKRAAPEDDSQVSRESRSSSQRSQIPIVIEIN